MTAKLYILEVSNTSRPIRALIAENKLPIEEVALDFYKGEHASEPYISLNPNALVPTLDDDGFILTESSAIMKYLADKFDLPSYPKDLKARAKVNELMDWFNTGFYRDYAYNVVYPQIYPHHKRPDDDDPEGHDRVGQGADEEVAEGAQRPLARQGQHVPGRRPADHRRHLRLCACSPAAW